MTDKAAMNVSEMAEQLGISKPKAYELANSEGFCAIKIGKRIIIPVSAFEAWLDKAATGQYPIKH